MKLKNSIPKPYILSNNFNVLFCGMDACPQQYLVLRLKWKENSLVALYAGVSILRDVESVTPPQWVKQQFILFAGQ